jgi:hypothetical protein
MTARIGRPRCRTARSLESSAMNEEEGGGDGAGHPPGVRLRGQGPRRLQEPRH